MHPFKAGKPGTGESLLVYSSSARTGNGSCDAGAATSPTDVREAGGPASASAHPFPSGCEPRRYTYRDCLDGTAPVPRDALGNAIFTLLMAGGMATFMVSFNGVRHSGLSFFFGSHWLYPVIFCIAMALRFLYVNRVVAYVGPRVIFPRFAGAARVAAMTLLNVAIMAPVMGSLVTLLLKGPDDLLLNLVTEVPLAMLVSIGVSLLVVGPAVKLLYHNVIRPTTSLRLCHLSQRFVTNWAGLFTG